MIPQFIASTGYLPPGIHDASWSDFVSRFETNTHRARLLGGLFAALRNLAQAGCKSVLLDGSFVTQKVFPADYDGAWEITGVHPELLDPILLDFSPGRAAMKAKYLGELFPADLMAEPGTLYVDFFQRDRNGMAKGIVCIDLGGLP